MSHFRLIIRFCGHRAHHVQLRLNKVEKDSDFFLSGKKTLIGGVHQREKGWATWAFGVWLHSESERESIYVCEGEDNQSGRT